MPNTEVKLTNAESTWPEAAREDRKLLIKGKDLQRCESFLHTQTWVIGHFVLVVNPKNKQEMNRIYVILTTQ